MFEIKNVSRVFGNEFALNNVSLEIKSGMNFIIGASGSGKTTLLKILCGMDRDFDGQAYYKGKNLKELSDKEKSEYYANTFGFIWQNFNLIEELTVFDNIKLPLYLNKKVSEKLVNKTMKDLKIDKLRKQKVKNLSGGQKQRVAIARELVKNPEVIIADEPTAALDPKSSAMIMDILNQIAKTRTVIIVTHDTSLINNNNTVFELDKGELVSVTEKEHGKVQFKKSTKKPQLSFSHAISLSMTNIKSKMGRYAVLMLAIMVSTSFLLINISGSIQSSSQRIFDDLINTYGEGVLDISVTKGFMSASGSEQEQKPNVNITQDISGIYDKYFDDERVEHMMFSQAFRNIQVVVEGKEYTVESSGNVPEFNKLLSGEKPMGNGNEVVVSEIFVKNLGLTNEEAIGRTIEFSGTLINWTTGKPIEKLVKTTVKIVGVADTTVTYDIGGEKRKVTVDDSFFFSKNALTEMRKQAEMKTGNVNFTIRAKTPADMISIKDELTANGIVPLGRFELIEDIVRLNSQSEEQSSSAYILIGILALMVSLAISLITAVMRKREYAIYKINGYSNSKMTEVTFTEYLIIGVSTIVLFFGAYPMINKATESLFSANILNGKSFATSIVLIILISVLCATITSLVSATVKESKCLKTGDR
ncbi:ABC transporter ATP-binding protein/permease [Oceanirhabdus seepicola]|uniref:ABC transporter ATP-binding protein/permease n=1 Tax=Oceanirhabdus seepicola TaxID=2828781 RepID=A0A9J6P5E4_9CLOT|nr:ABC transporter ATP-binding protein/permease [Oceanirhabdus seepicola]MCM1991329.1 ABC transporter ATP-binding protein/permease [Oceanirhabdus seepicola]